MEGDAEARLSELLATVFPEIGDGWLAGPFTIPGSARLPGDMPVYVSKLRTVVV
jgi:hypothetical protein